MGVGSEVYSALRNGRRAIGIELKPSYFRQAQANIRCALTDIEDQKEIEFQETEPLAAAV
jgi:hypothetical protein